MPITIESLASSQETSRDKMEKLFQIVDVFVAIPYALSGCARRLAGGIASDPIIAARKAGSTDLGMLT